jgi:hypothetical protein
VAERGVSLAGAGEALLLPEAYRVGCCEERLHRQRLVRRRMLALTGAEDGEKGWLGLDAAMQG